MWIEILIAKTQAVSNSCRNHSYLMYARKKNLKIFYVGHWRYSHLSVLELHGQHTACIEFQTAKKLATSNLAFQAFERFVGT